MGGDCEEGLACNYPALPCGAQTATCGPNGWTLAEDRNGCAQDAGQTEPRPGDGTDGGGSSLEGAGGSAGNGGDAGGAGDGRMDAGSDGPQTTELPPTELPPTEPPMEVLDEGCPAETPARGTPCQTDRFCEYGEICAPGHALASCASGSWEVQPNPVACNPPPPEPEPAPAPGGLDEARDRRR